MKKLIAVRLHDGRSIWVNPAHIALVEFVSEASCLIHLSGVGEYLVKPQENEALLAWLQSVLPPSQEQVADKTAHWLSSL